MERVGGLEERRGVGRTWTVATGTLACPNCDLPVASGKGIALGAPLACPWCDHSGWAREFFTIATSPRPARVNVIATLTH